MENVPSPRPTWLTQVVKPHSTPSRAVSSSQIVYCVSGPCNLQQAEAQGIHVRKVSEPKCPGAGGAGEEGKGTA